MSTIQVTSLESTGQLSVNNFTAGQTTVNSTGVFVGSNLSINSSAIKVISQIDNVVPLYGTYSTGNNIISPVISTDSLNFYKEQKYSDFSNNINLAWADKTWYMAQCTINTTTDIPPGATTAYKLTEDNTTNSHLITYDYFYPYSTNINARKVGEIHTVELLAKSDGREGLYITMWGENGSFFNLLNGTCVINANDPNHKSSIEPIGNGWYKCKLSTKVTNTTDPNYNSVFPYIYLASVNENGNYTVTYAGDGTSGVKISSLKSYKHVTSLYTETVNTQIFVTDGTWTKPAWANTGKELVIVHMWGGGGGGTANASGGGGGGGGAFVFGYYRSTDLGATANVVVGGGGGGATLPSGGGTGGTSSFANSTNGLLFAFGGAGGVASGFSGGGGGGWQGSGSGAQGGSPLGGPGSSVLSTFGGGGGSGTSAQGGSSIYGGGGGGSSASAAGGGGSIFGGAGGTAGFGAVVYSIYGGFGGSTTAGGVPGGGGGATTGPGFNGGRGEVRVYTLRYTGV